ncbi:MAG: hypothetical protein AAGD11_06220 [Planctomycetota bacterium]
MEPFKVICVTCHAKLSVRNEALIGQILGCPRCGSMVEVARPASPSPPLAAEAASTGSTINITARQIETLDDAASAPTEHSIAEPADVSDALPAEALLATTEVARYKLVTWTIASFVVGASIVGAIVYKSTRTQTEPTDAQPIASDYPVVDEEILTQPITADPAVESARESEVETVTASDAETASVVVATEPAEPASDPLPPTAVNDHTPPGSPPTPKQTDTAQTPSTTSPESQPSPTLVVEPAPRLARRFDPLEVDLESLSLTTVDQQDQIATEASEIPTPEQTVSAPIEPPAVESAPQPLRTTQLGPQDRVNAAERDAKRQLALIIPTVQASDMTFVDALRLISQLSGQPVTVAPEQLLMAGITPSRKVSLQVADMSMGDALAALLEPLRLEYVTDGPQVLVHRQQADKLRQIEYPIDDLVSTEQDEAVFADWIEQLVAPQSWQASGGEGKLEVSAGQLKVTQPQQVQYQVLIMLERLRLARNLPPKSRYPVKRLAGTPAQVVLADKLNQSATFTFSQFTALAEVFAYWQHKLEAPVLVDWPALAAQDKWPSTTITAAVIEEPWHAALSNVLQPIGLGWRAATGGAIEITTAAKIENELQLEIYPLTSSVDLDKLRALAVNEGGVLLYDSVGNVVLSRQPAATQRLILEELIRQQAVED